MNTRQMLLVHNHKGGTGKTTLAVHLAEYLVGRGTPWCFLDIDAQHNGISWLTGHQWKGEDTIRLPADGYRAPLTISVDPGIISGIDRLIVDTPPADSLLQSLSQYVGLTPEDIVICPVNGRLAIDGAIKVAEEVQPTGCRVVLVANLTDPREDHAREEIKAIEELAAVDDLNVEVFRLAIPRNDVYMREAELVGMPIWDLPHGSRTHTAQALRAFCQWIADGAAPDANLPRAHSRAAAQGYRVPDKLRQRLWSR